MMRGVVGDNRSQSNLFPDRSDNCLSKEVWAIEVLVDELDLAGLGFGYHWQNGGIRSPSPYSVLNSSLVSH